MPGASARVLTESHPPRAHSPAAVARDISGAEGVSDSDSSDSSSEEQPPQPLPAAEVDPVADKDDLAEDENDVLPPLPASDTDGEGKVEPGQAFESLYKHGVAPAKLPALENDNAHEYRHSIIYPYGDDIHA